MAHPGWPRLRVDDWTPTRETVHMWTQIVGRIRMAHAPAYAPAMELQHSSRAQPHACWPTGRSDCTDGDKAGPRADDPPSACQRVDGALWASGPKMLDQFLRRDDSVGAVLGRVGDVGQEPVRGSRTPLQMECEQCGS